MRPVPRWEALTWSSLRKLYRRYRRLPFVTGFSKVLPDKDGGLSLQFTILRRRQGDEKARRLTDVIRTFGSAGILPRQPRRLTQRGMDRIVKRVRERRMPGIKADELQLFLEAGVLS